MRGDFSPGPWHVGLPTSGIRIIAADSNRVAIVDDNAHVPGMFNAQVIAASPDLLHACNEAETAFAVVQLCDDLTPQARSAVREARRLCQDAIAKARPGSLFAKAVAEAWRMAVRCRAKLAKTREGGPADGV